MLLILIQLKRDLYFSIKIGNGFIDGWRLSFVLNSIFIEINLEYISASLSTLGLSFNFCIISSSFLITSFRNGSDTFWTPNWKLISFCLACSKILFWIIIAFAKALNSVNFLSDTSI